MGRRVQKAVSVYTGGIWQPEREILFVYDGWNVIKETTTLAGQPPASKYYVWGLDLSQSQQGAGGIGGLLAVIDNGTTHNFCYDANGNVGQLVNAATGTITAHYEYLPFGELIHSYGHYAGENGYRFSTKYFDEETGLYFYGYRYYSPQLSRWINRDPIGERGGLNFYAFVSNNPLMWLDYNGLAKITGEWFRKPYIENFNFETENWRFVFELSKKRIEGARVAYFDLNLSANLGFTVYCKCGDDDYWYIVGRVNNASKTVPDIPVIVGPLALKLFNVLTEIAEHYNNIDRWMEFLLEAYPRIMEGPQAMCEASVKIL